MKWMEFGVGSTKVPIELAVNDQFGGVPGETPTVSIRRVPDGYYLDFADNTFKNSGWTTLQVSLTAGGDGRYRYLWNSSLSVKTPTVVAVEFNNPNGSAPGIDDDHITFSNSAAILERLSRSTVGSVGDGPGNCKFEYRLTKQNSAIPIPDVKVYVTTDVEGNIIVAGPKLTDVNGKVYFYLTQSVQYYFWRSRGGYSFSNPDLQSF